ncbi:MAG: hypothetical protein LBQ24_01610 [Candidatus Peribacteria bacterium]|jgi:hypothetical protein|nr:hypothetical protein [Candidatus Peribacteria bacterium]
MYPSLILQILEDEYDKYEYESISEIKNRLAELEEEICTYDNKTINEFSELHNFFEQCSDENILEIALKLLREITE